MDYQKHYDLLCERARNRQLKCYTERHHIVPRCMGGTDEPDNLVELTPEEHYVAHQLLVKMYPGRRGLVWAAHQMTGHWNRKRNSNKLYGWLRRRNQKIARQRVGEKNGSYGRHWFHCPETKKSIKCKPEEAPSNYIRGKYKEIKHRCSICGKPSTSRNTNSCEEHRPARLIAIKRYNDFIDSGCSSIREFAKVAGVSQPALSNAWKRYIPGYEATPGKRKSVALSQNRPVV